MGTLEYAEYGQGQRLFQDSAQTHGLRDKEKTCKLQHYIILASDTITK